MIFSEFVLIRFLEVVGREERGERDREGEKDLRIEEIINIKIKKNYFYWFSVFFFVK